MEELTGLRRFLVGAVVFIGMFVVAYIVEVAGLTGLVKFATLALAGVVFSTLGYFLSKALKKDS